MKDSKGGMIIFIALVLFFVLLAQCGKEEKSERNRVGSTIDWGDDYYWDSKTESVQRTFSSYFD